MRIFENLQSNSQNISRAWCTPLTKSLMAGGWHFDVAGFYCRSTVCAKWFLRFMLNLVENKKRTKSDFMSKLLFLFLLHSVAAVQAPNVTENTHLGSLLHLQTSSNHRSIFIPAIKWTVR